MHIGLTFKLYVISDGSTRIAERFMFTYVAGVPRRKPAVPTKLFLHFYYSMFVCCLRISAVILNLRDFKTSRGIKVFRYGLRFRRK